MKTYVDMYKIVGGKKSLDISTIQGGYVRSVGGAVAIGYEAANGRRYELCVDRAALDKLLREEVNRDG